MTEEYKRGYLIFWSNTRKLEIYNVANPAWPELWNELCHDASTYAFYFTPVLLEEKNKQHIKP